jgi:SAM-dependent methyltransferase
MSEAAGHYDTMGEAYAAHSDSGSFNALYDRPAIMELAGNVRGKRVIDVGCAAGALSEALVEAGARVLGIDVSRAMVEIAERRLAGRAEFRAADIGKPIDFVPTGSVDVITASLVMHYLEDWGPALREFHRMLAPHGCVVLSTHHPGEDWHWFNRPNYFAVERVNDHFHLANGVAEVRFYRRPLSAIFTAIRAAGFWVDELAEPRPLPECEEQDPRGWALLTTQPRLLYLRLLKRGRS